MKVVVTQHAIDRYIERIAPVDRASAEAMIASAEGGIAAAVRFGASIVRAARAKLILQVHEVPDRGDVEAHVVTVYPLNWIEHQDLTNFERAQRLAEHRAAWQ